MNSLGVMQGRLSPPLYDRIQAFPVQTWEKEFFSARDLGLSFIEWVFDVDSAETTPLLTNIEKVKEVQAASGVRVGAVCGDYFRDKPVFRIDSATLKERLAVLEKVASACRAAAIPAVMLPFVDHSAIGDDAEFSSAVAGLKAALPIIHDHGLKLLLETNLEPDRYKKFMEAIADPALKVNYDIGDCVSLGHEATAELALLAPWLAGFHVKDRKRGGISVPLGEGDADFPAAFKTLAKIGYQGPITLQTARGADELGLAAKNMGFVRSLLAAS